MLRKVSALASHTDIEELVRACYAAYVNKDRAAIESRLSDDFHFTSPLDNRIDKAAYFKICWPNSEQFEAVEIESVLVGGDRAAATYNARLKGNKQFRNTEVYTVRDGKITEVEVYFGWNIPHPAPPGKHRD
jgi:ketosteroid isomerase-like protein